VKSVAFNKWQ